MKIVIAAAGTHGDVVPVVALAIALRNAGHKIVICAPKGNEELLGRYGFELNPIGVSYKDFMKEQADKMKKGFLSEINAYTMLMEMDINNQTEGLVKAAEGADLLVLGGCIFIGQTVAEYLGIPFEQVGYTFLDFTSKHHAPTIIPCQTFPPWMNLILWKLSTGLFNITVGKTVNKHRKKLGLPKVKDAWSHCIDKNLITGDNALIPVPDDIKAKYTRTGYWCLPEENEELDAEIVKFIENGSPPIFIGFGSMSNVSPDKIKDILKEIVNTMNYRIVIAKLWGDMGEGLKAENVLKIGYAPFSKLFPKMAVVIHHGGMGTTHTAAKAGVPQIILPHLADQFYSRKLMYQLGLSPKPVNRLNSKNLIAAIEEAVSSTEIREAARKMGEEMKKQDGVKEALTYIHSQYGSK